jgi:hypothetical protein
MVGAREHWAAGIAAWAVVLGLVCESALGREVKLTIYPQKMLAEAGTYSLLPPQASLTDGNAVPLYDKAIKTLPGKAMDEQIGQWLKIPVEQLPADQVEKVVTQYIESLKCVAKAVKCPECRWPPCKPGMEVANSEEYRRLAFSIRLWARLELSNAEYEGAMLALQTGFAMARQIGQAPSPAQAQLGGLIGAAMCSEVERLVQIEGSPNLYAALASLPKPFVDIERAIESEKTVASSGLTGRLSGKQFEAQMKAIYDRYRAAAKILDSELAVLQCVEAIRSYAASRSGQLPQSLADLKESPAPQDPLSGKAFRYTRVGSTAMLEPAAAVSGQVKYENRYEIVVKN